MPAMRAISQLAATLLLIAIAISGAFIVYTVLTQYIFHGVSAPKEVEVSVVSIKRVKTGTIYYSGSNSPIDADYLYAIKLAIYNAGDEPALVNSVTITDQPGACQGYNVTLIETSVPEVVPPHTILYATVVLAVQTGGNPPPDTAYNAVCPILMLALQPRNGIYAQVILDPFKTPEEVRVG